jgi:hypothetical protein
MLSCGRGTAGEVSALSEWKTWEGSTCANALGAVPYVVDGSGPVVAIENMGLLLLLEEEDPLYMNCCPIWFGILGGGGR